MSAKRIVKSTGKASSRTHVKGLVKSVPHQCYLFLQVKISHKSVVELMDSSFSFVC